MFFFEYAKIANINSYLQRLAYIMDKQLSVKRKLHSVPNIALEVIKPVLPRIESSSLFNDVREIIIDHMGQEYHLRVTNQGKLLLTK